MGKTGSGKTTLIDLIAGLLYPNEGKVLVDQEKIDESLNSWQSRISYIDQNVTLLDGSIIENISLQHQNNNEINVKFLMRFLRFLKQKSLSTNYLMVITLKLEKEVSDYQGGKYKE